MSTLIDSPVWSEFLRRAQGKGNPVITEALSRLIRRRSAILIGSVRQEVLSGIADSKVFMDIRSKMSIFDDFATEPGDYIHAAELFNRCRSAGVQASHTDMLICAVSIQYGMEIFTLDKDFTHYAKAIPIRLYKV